MKNLMENWRGYLHEQSAATVGDLLDAVEVIRKAQNKEAATQKFKKIGGVAARFGLGLITAGLSEVVAQAVDTGEAIKDIFDAVADPDAINSGKLKNQPWIELLGIDDNFSRIVDDKIEKQILVDLISKYTGSLARMNRNSPLPNFTNLIAKKLNRMYLKSSPLGITKK